MAQPIRGAAHRSPSAAKVPRMVAFSSSSKRTTEALSARRVSQAPSTISAAPFVKRRAWTAPLELHKAQDSSYCMRTGQLYRQRPGQPSKYLAELAPQTKVMQ